MKLAGLLAEPQPLTAFFFWGFPGWRRCDELPVVKGGALFGPVQPPPIKCLGGVDKKNPTTPGGQSHGAKFFSGGFEEDCFRSACHRRPLIYLQAACHNSPSMVFNIFGSSRKIYVGIRKKKRSFSRK
jgi:hypothetical protein